MRFYPSIARPFPDPPESPLDHQKRQVGEPICEGWLGRGER